MFYTHINNGKKKQWFPNEANRLPGLMWACSFKGKY